LRNSVADFFTPYESCVPETVRIISCFPPLITVN